MPDELYDEETGATPSQQAMDAQTAAATQASVQQTLGALKLGAQQIVTAVGEGADRESARELLGRMDSLARGQTYENEDQEIYQDYERFLRVHRSAPQRAAPAARASGGSTPAASKASLNKRREAYHKGETNVYPG